MRLEQWVYKLPLRLKSLFQRARVEQDLNDELAWHLDLKTDEYIQQGLSPDDARATAMREMDGLARRREECREARGVTPIENAVRDARYSLRLLAKSPGFTAVAVVTLALAIGANAVVFGMLNALILRPVNLPQAESLYGLEHAQENSMYESYPDYRDLRDRNHSFEDLAAFDIEQAGLDTGGDPYRAWGAMVSGNYFDALGIQPYVGRFFHGSDEHGANSAPLIVLGYGYWHAHLHDDRGVVGRTVELNKHSFTVVGVAPAEFHSTFMFFSPAFYVPMVQQEAITGTNELEARGKQSVFMVIGHLKPGVTPAQAVADLNSVGAWIARTWPGEHGVTSFRLARPFLYGDYLGGPVRAFLSGLLLLSGLILLAACANLGNLFAARAAERSREMALRLALGATRGRVLRQLFTEALLIALMGGAAGLWASVMLLGALSAWQPFPRFPLHVPVSPDAKVYVVALLLALISGVLFGLVPVRQVLRIDPYQIVKAGPGGTPGRRIRARDLLLGAQIAICAVLVTSSMVALRGLMRTLDSNFGFDPRGAMLVNTDLNMAGYSSEQAEVMEKRMIDSMKSISGVESVGLVDWAPLSNGSAHGSIVFRDDTTDLRPSNQAAECVMYKVSPGYLEAARTALLAGRTFSWHDDKNAPRVAVVNREFAARVFGSPANALHRTFKLPDGTRIQVAGIVQDGKYINLTEDAVPAMFVPILQSASAESAMVVRSQRDPRELARAIRRSLHALDPGLPAYIETWNEAMNLPRFPARMATISLGVLGGMGAMLSITGLFGMAAYSLSRRLKELGIRMALGARGRELLQAALGRAVRLLAFGSLAGFALGVLASRVLAAIVYHATPRDPLVLAGVVLAMALVGLVATWIPAQRALSLDPAKLLREE